MPYSHPQPLDRRDLARVVRHLLPGACALAATAGCVNSVALGFFHAPVSHMTGAVSHLGIDLAEGGFRDASAAISIIGGFVGGAMLAGLLLGGRRLVPGRRFGVAMMVEGLLLTGATALLATRHRLGLPLTALACGLQNGMSSSYCGMIIRTTHVTGLATDVGVMLGHWLRHRAVDARKLLSLTAIFVSFGAGGWAGAVLDLRFGGWALLMPAGGCLLAGALFWWLAAQGRLRLPAERGVGG